jgi:hypothetical protein
MGWRPGRHLNSVELDSRLARCISTIPFFYETLLIVPSLQVGATPLVKI